jgi:hypothetical protein
MLRVLLYLASGPGRGPDCHLRLGNHQAITDSLAPFKPEVVAASESAQPQCQCRQPECRRAAASATVTVPPAGAAAGWTRHVRVEGMQIFTVPDFTWALNPQ